MPNLWNDYTTDEAAKASGYANRSTIIKRIHAQKQTAITAKMGKNPNTRRWRYWITQHELHEAKKSWPKNARRKTTPNNPKKGNT